MRYRKRLIRSKGWPNAQDELWKHKLVLSLRTKSEVDQNEFSNIQELVKDGINVSDLEIRELRFQKTSDLVWAWTLTFLNITTLKVLELNSLSLSFLDELTKVLKLATNIDSLRFDSWKLMK